MITPRLVNHKAYTPRSSYYQRDVCFCPCDAWRNWVALPAPITYPEWAVFLCNRECYNLWCLSGRQPLLVFRQPCCQDTGHWLVVCSGVVSVVSFYRVWPEDHSVCPFCGAVVLGHLLGSDPLSWLVVQSEDPIRESHIPGRNVGKLTLLLYPIVLPGSM